MKILRIFSLILLISFSAILSLESKTLERSPKDPTGVMYYWDKGNRGEKLTKEEFKILMDELEKSLKDFKFTASIISISDADMSYNDGKAWEITLNDMSENIDSALKLLKSVNSYPNSLSISLSLYIVVNRIIETAYDFRKISVFNKALKDETIGLKIWCTAFQKAHLMYLAIERDKRDRLPYIDKTKK